MSRTPRQLAAAALRRAGLRRRPEAPPVRAARALPPMPRTGDQTQTDCAPLWPGAWLAHAPQAQVTLRPAREGGLQIDLRDQPAPLWTVLCLPLSISPRTVRIGTSRPCAAQVLRARSTRLPPAKGALRQPLPLGTSLTEVDLTIDGAARWALVLIPPVDLSLRLLLTPAKMPA